MRTNCDNCGGILVDGKCPIHPNREIEIREEENYFFRLSKYKTKLIEWANESVDFIEPNSKRVEFLGILHVLIIECVIHFCAIA
jgi:methionyl-tRNA synthetase